MKLIIPLCERAPVCVCVPLLGEAPPAWPAAAPAAVQKAMWTDLFNSGDCRLSPRGGVKVLVGSPLAALAVDLITKNIQKK